MPENKGGPAAQARARTIFPNTGGTIIGGLGTSAIATGPQLAFDTKVLPKRSSRVLPLDLISARVDALMTESATKRFGAEVVEKMRTGQAKLVAAFKAAQAPDDDRAVPVTPRALPAKATTTAKKK